MGFPLRRLSQPFLHDQAWHGAAFQKGDDPDRRAHGRRGPGDGVVRAGVGVNTLIAIVGFVVSFAVVSVALTYGVPAVYAVASLSIPIEAAR